MDPVLLWVGISLAVTTIAAFLLLSRLIATKRSVQALVDELEPLRENRERLDNVEVEAKRIMDNARAEAERQMRDARAVASSAAMEAERAKEQARTEAEGVERNARSRADAILSNAQKEADKIRDNLSESLTRMTEMRMTIKGLKNIIEGYGDEYIVPTKSVLDDLGVYYGFKDAGAALTRARERTRSMIQAGAAAECDYVEKDRQEAAIRFVTDAFVGKTDSILAKVKSDNYGKLEQAMRDAYAIINTNGHAFRNARVREEFLNVRLQELKWATAVMELQNKEREEQRAIKERLREEERAQKEFERSIKEAEKSEETIRKAIEKAQKDAEKASEEQRALFEQKLRELAEKLREAEAKSQRALSMAQQTKSGHVYIISNVGSFGEEMLKIGMTRRLEPVDRVRELGDASVPFSFDVHAMIFSDDAPRLERDLHLTFVESQVNKVNPRKEFFRVPLTAVREKIEAMGIGVSWTMAAEAKEYHESLAIEKTLKDRDAHDRWVESQKAVYSADFDLGDGTGDASS